MLYHFLIKIFLKIISRPISLKHSLNFLLKKFHRLIVKHILKEANKCANVLTKLRVTQFFDYVNFDSPLIIVENLLTFDIAKRIVTDLFIANKFFNVV